MKSCGPFTLCCCSGWMLPLPVPDAFFCFCIFSLQLNSQSEIILFSGHWVLCSQPVFILLVCLSVCAAALSACFLLCLTSDLAESPWWVIAQSGASASQWGVENTEQRPRFTESHTCTQADEEEREERKLQRSRDTGLHDAAYVCKSVCEATSIHEHILF